MSFDENSFEDLRFDPFGFNNTVNNWNKNRFPNKKMHSGIITADLSDHFPTFIIFKDLTVDSSNEPIYLTKPEINDKSIADFKTPLSIADWKHVLNAEFGNF